MIDKDLKQHVENASIGNQVWMRRTSACPWTKAS